MTARFDDDRLLSAWLHDRAPSREPEHLLGEVLARTARARRRPAWRNPERLHLMSAITSRLAPATPVPWRPLAAAALILLALVVGLVLAASGAFRSPAPPYGLAANGALLYSEGGDIYLRTSASSTPKLLVTGETTDDSPVISFDGTHFSFLRHLDDTNAEIWIANIDGSNLQKLDIAGTRPSWLEWSGDGKTAVVVEDSHPFRLTIASLGVAPATFELPVSIELPFFRPGHANQIAFVGTAPGGDRGIYLVNTDGSGLTQLALDPGYLDTPRYGEDKWAYFWQQSWSAAGDRLLYVTIEPNDESADGRGWRIHMASVDATGTVSSDRLLVFDATADDEFVPAWLPDGKGFVFESVEGLRHWLSVATLDATGNATARDLGVTANNYLGSQISPDGRYLITKVPHDDQAPTVTLVDLVGGSVQELPVGEDVGWQRLAP
jgi:Tol biopolymer transport system component